ncbi:chromosome partitioning protein [Actinoplanes sp. URMC 104]|uniref:MinD/ParA family ATP-binding protein n=1 Tax=Actinoplanes sp. URMC 104 TaxID=3423409 RepID=UPI003F1A3004
MHTSPDSPWSQPPTYRPVPPPQQSAPPAFRPSASPAAQRSAHPDASPAAHASASQPGASSAHHQDAFPAAQQSAPPAPHQRVPLTAEQSPAAAIDQDASRRNAPAESAPPRATASASVPPPVERPANGEFGDGPVYRPPVQQAPASGPSAPPAQPGLQPPGTTAVPAQSATRGSAAAPAQPPAHGPAQPGSQAPASGPAMPGPQPPAHGPAQPDWQAPASGPAMPGPQPPAQPGLQPPAHGPAQPGPQPPAHGPAQPGPQPPAYRPAAVPPQPAPYGPQAYPPPGPYPPTMDPQALQPPPTDPFQDLPWVSDGTPTAEEFARRRMAKPADPVATQGARAILRKGTMGLVRLAPGKREQEYKQDVEMVRRNFGGLRQVTVVNPKGGAGKTVAVLLLAMTFGQKRGGYVLAWDNNETQGTLGMRAQQDFHARTVRDMMRDLHLFRGSHGRVGDLSQYVRAQGEGMFDVLASDESATAGEMLTASAFGEIREIVSRFYKLIFVDTGNNVRAQNWQAAMDATDQLVITMSARNDSAETAARMLDHLEQSGRQRLVRQAVSVVSMPPTRKDIDLPAIQRHFAARTRAVMLAPYEKLIDSGEPIRYGHLSNNTKDAWLKIAAAVAEGL